jgi:hypothetical protein
MKQPEALVILIVVVYRWPHLSAVSQVLESITLMQAEIAA